mmetsp:Transcript_14915/g.25884  ORF Transcript_14915/g.25884 Transcript_14915/m.25884 type:complete len:336 (-) Transcript_14915:1130-2137(-)
MAAFIPSATSKPLVIQPTARFCNQSVPRKARNGQVQRRHGQSLTAVMFGDPVKRQGTELYDELLALYKASKLKKPAETKKWFDLFDNAAWDLFQGRKERIWSPDIRPKDQRGVFNPEASTLSWGRRDPFATGEVYPVDKDGKQMGSIEYSMTVLDPCLGPNPPEYCRVDDYVQLTESGKDEMTGKLQDQIQYMADIADRPNDERSRTLSGRELAELIFRKYGYYHDVAILQANFLGDDISKNRQWAINFYGAYLGLPDFPMTEAQYLKKLDEICDMLMAFDQCYFVRQFLNEPIYPRRGLPSRPRFDTAVTLRLNSSPTWKYVSKDILEQYVGSL